MIWIAALFVAAGIAVTAWGLAERQRTKRDALERLLEAELAEPSRPPDALADLVERLGDAAERRIGGTDLAEKIRLTLTRTGWTIRPGELTAILLIGTVAVGFLALLVTGSLFVAVSIGALVPLGAVSWIARTGRKRLERIEGQLPTMLQVLASSLDSGASVLGAMELASTDGDPPLADEFSRVVAETRVGRPLVESLEAMAARVGSNDLTWTVEAIRIQHQAGGRLADTLRILADFMRTRLEVRGEVRALSAEARLSAKVLTGLPIVLAGYLFGFRRSYFEPLYTTSGGKAMIAVAVVGIVAGSLWMRRLARVEV